jgi:putative transposase
MVKIAGRAVSIPAAAPKAHSLSTGGEIDNPQYLRHSESGLKKAQRRVSRRVKESKRKKKAVKLLAKKHQHVARQRRNFHFEEAAKLVKTYRVIKFEDLNIKGMVKNHHLAKSISDAGWSQFITITVHKAEEAGGQVEVVNAAGTSTRCSRCGQDQRMPLRIRVYRCGNCGLVIDRDHNSGINIKERKGRIVLSRRRRDTVVEEARTCRATDSESPTGTRSVQWWVDVKF